MVQWFSAGMFRTQWVHLGWLQWRAAHWPRMLQILGWAETLLPPTFLQGSTSTPERTGPENTDPWAPTQLPDSLGLQWVCVSNNSQVMLTLMVWGPHFKNCCCGGKSVFKYLNLEYHSVWHLNTKYFLPFYIWFIFWDCNYINPFCTVYQAFFTSSENRDLPGNAPGGVWVADLRLRGGLDL